MADNKPYIGFNNSGIVNLDDNETGAKMLDKLSRLQDGRRSTPLDQFDNVVYPHRYQYDNYNLLIGDTYFMIPPEFIAVTSESNHQSLVTLRQENTQKVKAGYHKRMIMIDLVFNGIDQLNGYKVNGPEGTYYVDGLRQLLAQFKCTPFLPISNELINGMYGIFTVALQSITIQTMPGYPDAMIAHITLQEVNMFPYLQMPDAAFKYMIDWDLFRFYYQRFLTEDHVYKKLQSLPVNKEHNKFKISILDESVFDSQEATKYNLLQILCDKKIVKTTEDGNFDTTNYTTWVDSSVDNVNISAFQCNYANILTNVQLSDAASPTVQFMGGMDTIYNITFETTDYSVVQSLEQCQVTNDILTRNNKKFSSLGFVKLESELVEFTGSLFVMIESVMTNTVPGFPGLYNVQIQCVAYDIAQSEREDLKGFMPFECDKSGRCGDFVNGEGFVSDHDHIEQAIEQSMQGLLVKIKQDVYAENKLRTNVEVYPDLRLPTYSEVDAAIIRIRDFRERNGLSQLPYSQYPKSSTCMLHGLPLNNNVSFSHTNASESIIDIETINASVGQYDGFVDPDFYVFYPTSYTSFMEDNPEYYNDYNPKSRSSFSKSKVVEKHPVYNGVRTNGNLIEQFIKLSEKYIGYTYELGCYGNKYDANGNEKFDCIGFIYFLLKKIGVMPSSTVYGGITYHMSNYGEELYDEVPWSEMQRGDLLTELEDDGGYKHIVIYKGDNKIIHAANSNPYPRGGVKESNLYFSNGRCYRPKAFIVKSSSALFTSEPEGVAAYVWSILKTQYNLPDHVIAGILGNAQAESSLNPANLQQTYETSLGYTDKSYTEAVDNGTYTKFVTDGAGYGLFQFTYHTYKQGLLATARLRNVSISDVQLQVDVLMSQLAGSGGDASNPDAGSILSNLLNTTTVADASNVMLLQYEKPANMHSKKTERANYSQSFYDRFKGTNEVYNSTSEASENTITTAEFESICRIIMAETKGETSDAEQAMAQVIYDRLTHPSKNFGGLSNILNGGKKGFPAPYDGKLNKTIEDNVKAVFCKNDKYWKDYQAWYFLTPDDDETTFEDRDNNYDKLGEVDTHTFWGKKSTGSNIKYTIVDSKNVGNASDNNYSYAENVTHEAITMNSGSVKKFGQPAYIKTGAIMYDNNWEPWAGSELDVATDELNSTENIFNTSFCDEVQYSGRGKLIRAFPTYLFCILDDQAQWYDGRKLWTNYYIHRSVVDISVHATNDMPVETATIVVTNSYHNLDRIQGGLSSYKLSEDEDYNAFQQWWYSWSGTIFGFGPKLTSSLIKLHQVIYDQAKLREGARIHLRMGYGSDPLSLAPVMNGHISDVALGDQITIVAVSDGQELIQHITSANKNDTNAGFLGLFGLGESQESSNIIAETLCKRNSWVTHLMGSTFEGSKYSIEHFGIYFNKSLIKGFKSEAPDESINNDSFLDIISDIWDGHQENYDLLKNVYKANYKRQHYIYTTAELGSGNEQNIVFNKYNMTPWDVFQICTQQVPEYIIKPTYHQFDSRLYFGLPFWMEKYRYDYLNGTVYEECKAAAQVHFIDSMDCIIDNQVKVTSKFSNTNIKVMYTRGSESMSTDIIHSDDSIDFSKQKTTILDTPIVQDALGPDALYEILGYSIGEDSARRVGISNLLYGWQQQYQGQLLLMGHPGLKPHDYMMVNDTFANLFGLSIVREVVHSFNVNTGFTTSVVPGMIGFCTDENSGMIQSTQNYLMLLSCFANYTKARKELRNNYEKNISLIAELEIMETRVKTMSENLEEYVKDQQAINVTGVIAGDIAPKVAFTGLTYKFIKALRYGQNAHNTLNAIKDVIKVVKAAKGLKNIISAIKVGAAAVGVATGGLGFLVWAAVSVVIDVLLDDFFEWLSNKNVCVLLPMWWEGRPFVSGTKDGEKILLMGNDATATDENTKEDGTVVEENTEVSREQSDEFE